LNPLWSLPQGAPMCSKCDDLNDSINRFRRLSGQITDEKTRDAADRLVAELVAKKLALHPQE
jgi:hypothetical protein